jgi:hypothetical protein
MYMDQMISVGKATNGFIVECRVKFKKDAKKTDKMTSCCCGPSDYAGSCEKQYIAKDAKEVGELIADIMPLLEQDFSKEAEFDKAFEEATKDMESMDDMKGGK